MFKKQPYEKAERRLFGIFKTVEDISEEDKKLLGHAEDALNYFGGSFADKLHVEKFSGHDMKRTDEYMAIRPNQSK